MAQLQRMKYHYPWRRGNRFRLLVDGERFFPAMLAAIENARDYILLELYLFESGKIADRFIDALSAAAARGVRVCLLADDFGAYRLLRSERKRLENAGVEVTWFNPILLGRGLHLLFRNHRKLLLVDGRVAFTGGFGLADEFAVEFSFCPAWRETVIEITGPAVADWQDLFLAGWNRQNSQSLRLPAVDANSLPGGARGRVTRQLAFPGRSEVMRSQVRAVRRARSRVWLATAYFVPSMKMRRVLRAAARRDVDVRLLLPGRFSDHPALTHVGRRYYERLLRAGIRIFEYQPSFLHAKVLLCDDWVSIGSSNMDRWNYRFNLEANQEAIDPELAGAVARQFALDFKRSDEILYESWIQRPWQRHVLEWFWTRVGKVLGRLGRHRRGRFPIN